MANQADLKCPMCAGDSFTTVFQASTGYPIVRCQSCQLAFTDDRTAPPPDQLYPAFDQSDTKALKTARSALSVFLRQREKLVKDITTSGRLLDYGCGAGHFASWMSQSGFEVVGLEPFSLGAPREQSNLTLRREPLETAKLTLGKFDVITLWHVLEHIHSPVEVLKTLKGLLNPGGVIIVSVPNFDSLQSKVFTGGWFHLDAPRHFLHFEPRTLDECLNRSGLERAREWSFLPEYGTSGWVQSALNKVLPHSNFLYEVVKDRGALNSMSKLSQAGHLVASLAAGGPIAALTLPIEFLASARNQGAALTYAARAV